MGYSHPASAFASSVEKFLQLSLQKETQMRTGNSIPFGRLRPRKKRMTECENRLSLLFCSIK